MEQVQPSVKKSSLKNRKNSKRWYEANKNRVKQKYKERKNKNPEKIKLQSVFSFIKQRCYNAKNQSYKYYGGRGIKICDEWMSNRSLFYEWAFNNGYKNRIRVG